MKHWALNNDGNYSLAIDKTQSILGIGLRSDGSVLIYEMCDRYFQVKMSKSDLIEALRELADELESK
jgi:hypothetical protein